MAKCVTVKSDLRVLHVSKWRYSPRVSYAHVHQEGKPWQPVNRIIRGAEVIQGPDASRKITIPVSGVEAARITSELSREFDHHLLPERTPYVITKRDGSRWLSVRLSGHTNSGQRIPLNTLSALGSIRVSVRIRLWKRHDESMSGCILTCSDLVLID